MAINLNALRNFLSFGQLTAMRLGLNGEESAYFRDKLTEIDARIRDMPRIYAQDGKGDAAIVYLHYFLGGHGLVHHRARHVAGAVPGVRPRVASTAIRR